MNPSARPDAPDRGLLARAMGMVASPIETLRTVIRFPRPASMLLIVCALMAAATAAPQFTVRGRQATLELQVRQFERMAGQPVSPAMYERMEQQTARIGPYLVALNVFVTVPVGTLFFSALYWATFNILLGGTAAFKQVLGIVAHAQVINAVGIVIGAPIQYAQDTPSPGGPFSLAPLAPMLDPDGYAAALLNMLTVFQIWATVVTAVGLALLYRRRFAPVVTGLVLFHVVVMAGFAALFSLVSR
jgi:hypothetical protein